MFLEKEELKSVVYSYQLNEIIEVTEDDDTNDDIVVMAINAAVEEMKSYLAPNDGSTVRYDVEAIFSATGSDRHPLILELCKSIALWYICRLSNVDIVYDKVKDRYDRAIRWLEKVSGTGSSSGGSSGGGSITVSGLPTLEPVDDNDGLPYRMGSREKFNHE